MTRGLKTRVDSLEKARPCVSAGPPLGSLGSIVAMLKPDLRRLVATKSRESLSAAELLSHGVLSVQTVAVLSNEALTLGRRLIEKRVAATQDDAA